jgi:hypothetical protein
LYDVTAVMHASTAKRDAPKRLDISPGASIVASQIEGLSCRVREQQLSVHVLTDRIAYIQGEVPVSVLSAAGANGRRHGEPDKQEVTKRLVELQRSMMTLAASPGCADANDAVPKQTTAASARNL